MLETCPDREQLRDFVQGRLSDSDLLQLSQHLADCPDCSSIVKEINLLDDTVCEAVRNLYRTGLNSAKHPSNSPATDQTTSDTRPRCLAGQSLGRFELIEKVGEGSFGVVFRARDRRLGREVALKIPRSERRWTAKLLQRFESEAMIAAQLSHPHLLHVYDAGEIDGVTYIATEYCDGPTLDAWLRANRQPIPIRVAAQLALDVARAVEYAHRRGVLHRDIKPSNVMLIPTERGGHLADASVGTFIPKLGDFGLAIGNTDGDLLHSGSGDGSHRLGTPHYIAPEVILFGSQAATTESDVYAIGVVLFQLLTRQLPFPDAGFIDTITRQELGELHRPNSSHSVPVDLKSICLKCLSKSPGDRYRDAGLLADDLQNFLNDQPVLARPRGRLETTWVWIRQHPSLVVVIILALVGLLAWYRDFREHKHELEQALTRAEVGERNARAHVAVANIRLASSAIESREYELARNYLSQAEDFSQNDGDHSGRSSFECRYLKSLLPPAKPKHSASAHQGGTASILFTTNGQSLVTAGIDGQIIIWMVPSMKVERCWQAHKGDINRLIDCGDEESIASCGDDGFVRVWSLKSGTLKSEFDHGGRVFELAYLPGKHALIAAGDREGIVVWDLEKSREIHRMPGRNVRALAYSPASQILARALMDRGLIVSRLEDEKETTLFEAPSQRRTNDLVFSPRGDTVAAASRDGGIELWKPTNENSVAAWKGHIDAVHVLRYHPAGRLIASVSTDQTVAIWETSGKLVSRIRASSRPIWSLDISRDGSWMAIGDNAGQLSLWSWNDLLPGEDRKRIDVSGPALGRFATLIGTSSVARLSAESAFEVFDLKTKRDLAPIGKARDLPDLIDLASHPNGEIVIEASRGGDLIGWSFPGRGRRFTFPAGQGRIFAFGFPTGNQHFVTAAESGEVMLRSMTDGAPQRLLWRHQDLALCLAMAPNGTSLATGGEDRQVYFGTIHAGGPPPGQIAHQGVVSALCFLGPETLVSGDHDGKVAEWDLRYGRIIATYPGTTDRILALQQSPDRKTLVAGCRGGRIVCWNLATRQLSLAVETGPGTFVRDVMFAPDGTWLIAAVVNNEGHGSLQLFPAP